MCTFVITVSNFPLVVKVILRRRCICLSQQHHKNVTERKQNMWCHQTSSVKLMPSHLIWITSCNWINTTDFDATLERLSSFFLVERVKSRCNAQKQLENDSIIQSIEQNSLSNNRLICISNKLKCFITIQKRRRQLNLKVTVWLIGFSLSVLKEESVFKIAANKEKIDFIISLSCRKHASNADSRE